MRQQMFVAQSSSSAARAGSGYKIKPAQANIMRPTFKPTNTKQNQDEPDNQSQSSASTQATTGAQPPYQPQMMPFGGQQQIFPPHYFPQYYQPNQDQHRLMQFILERETAFTKYDAARFEMKRDKKMRQEQLFDRLFGEIQDLKNQQTHNHCHSHCCQPIAPYNIQPAFQPQIIRNLEEENRQLKQQYEDEMFNLEDENKRLHDDNRKLDNEAKHFENNNKLLIQDNKALKNEKEELYKQIEILNQEISALTNQLNSRPNEFDLNNQLQDRDNYINGLASKNDELKRENDLLNQRIGDLINKNNDLLARLNNQPNYQPPVYNYKNNNSEFPNNGIDRKNSVLYPPRSPNQNYSNNIPSTPKYTPNVNNNNNSNHPNFNPSLIPSTDNPMINNKVNNNKYKCKHGENIHDGCQLCEKEKENTIFFGMPQEYNGFIFKYDISKHQLSAYDANFNFTEQRDKEGTIHILNTNNGFTRIRGRQEVQLNSENIKYICKSFYNQAHPSMGERANQIIFRPPVENGLKEKAKKAADNMLDWRLACREEQQFAGQAFPHDKQLDIDHFYLNKLNDRNDVQLGNNYIKGSKTANIIGQQNKNYGMKGSGVAGALNSGNSCKYPQTPQHFKNDNKYYNHKLNNINHHQSQYGNYGYGPGYGNSPYYP